MRASLVWCNRSVDHAGEIILGIVLVITQQAHTNNPAKISASARFKLKRFRTSLIVPGRALFALFRYAANVSYYPNGQMQVCSIYRCIRTRKTSALATRLRFLPLSHRWCWKRVAIIYIYIYIWDIVTSISQLYMYVMSWGFWAECTAYPKKYAHGFALLCFVVVIHWQIFPISIRLTSLALWQSNDDEYG